MVRIVLGVAALAVAFAAGDRVGLAREQAKLDRNRALIARVHSDAWSQRDVAAGQRAAREIYAARVIRHDWTGTDSSGAQGVASDLDGIRQDFPDWTERPEMIVAEGDLVADRYLSTGTQARALGAIPHVHPGLANKGKFQSMPEAGIYRIVDGKIAEQWNLSDIWNAEIQLGMFDPDRWPESVCGKSKR